LAKWHLHDKNLADEIIAKAPNLLVEEYESTAVVGWDANNTKAEVERLKEARKGIAEQEKREEEQARAKEEPERKARWDLRCKPHRDLVARQRRPPSPWDIQHLGGSYIVHWHGEEPKQYADRYRGLDDPISDADVMGINVFLEKSSDGVKASFWFGMFEGIMLSNRGKSLRGSEMHSPKITSS